MKANLKRALALALALERADRRLADSVSAYSHAAAATDRVRIAAADPRADPGLADRAVRRAVADESAKLEGMVEDMEDQDASKARREAVRALEEAGLTSGVVGGWSHMRAGRHMVQMIRDLGVCRRAVGTDARPGVNPAYGRQRGGELVAQLEACGVDCS